MSGKSRQQRSDARDNVDRLQAAAVELLGRGGDPSMGEIAAAAGLSRQTAYSHFASRESLYDAVVTHLFKAAAEALDAELPSDPRAGLEVWLDRAWGLVHQHPALLNPAVFAGSSRARDTDVRDEHEPVTGGLRRALERARERDLLHVGNSTDWLLAAVIALAHAAAQEVMARRMPAGDAGAAFRSSALRLCLRDASVAGG